MVIGVLGPGWSDGYPRAVPANTEALVRGRLVRILPPAHLEHLRVDLSDVSDARFGDEVIILGRQGDQAITLEYLAKQWRIDPIGIYGRLRDQIPRINTG